MIVLDGRTHFDCDLETIYRKVMLPRARKLKINLPSPSSPCAEGYLLNPRINHNKWLVDCPWCHGAEFLWLEEPKFMCQNCWNSVVNHQWIAVSLPNDLEKIHEHLIKRPIPQTRNWNSDESHHDLFWENIEHGIT